MALDQLLLPKIYPNTNSTVKQLQKDGVPVFENKWQQPPPRKATESLEAYRSWVYRAVQMNSENVADIELHLKRKAGSEGVDIDTHEALDVLYMGNDFYDFNLMIQLIQTYLELVGEAFLWTPLDARGVPAEIIILRPDRVYIEPSKNSDSEEYIAYYVYRTGSGDIRFETEEILRFIYPNPLSSYRGKGSVMAADYAIDTDEFSSRYNRDFFYNSAIPKGVFKLDKRLLKTHRDRLEKSIDAKLGGRDNAHKPLILEAGMEWQEMGMKQKDMEFLNSRKFSRDEIFTIFGVPKDLINTEDSNRASVTEAINIYMKFTIKQRMKKLVSMLNKYFLPKFDQNIYFDFTDPSPSDIDNDIKLADAGARGGFLSINERRALFGYEPAEGGDEIVIQNDSTNEDPVKTGLKATRGRVKKENIQVLKQTSSQGKINKIKHEIAEIKDRVAQLKHQKNILDIQKMEVDNLFIQLQAGMNKVQKFSAEQKDMAWKVFDVIEQDYEKTFRIMLGSYLNGQQERILKQLKARKAIKGVSDANFNLPREKAIWVAKFRSFLERLIKSQGKNTLRFVGDFTSELNMESFRIKNFINNKAFEQVNDINKTTRKALKKELAEAIENEEGIPEITTRIKSLFKTIKDSRATTIARTETVRSYNFATLEGYFQSGVVKQKEWLATRDGRTRDTHTASLGVDGEVVNLDKRFSNDVFTPGYDGPAEEVVNCRCTTIPVLGQKAFGIAVQKLEQVKDMVNSIEQQRKKEEKTPDKPKKEEKVDYEKMSDIIASKILDSLNE